jgi:hypothetical protein
MCEKINLNFTSMPYMIKDFKEKGVPKFTQTNKQDYEMRCNVAIGGGATVMIFDIPNGEIYPTSTFNFINETTGEHYTVPPNTPMTVVFNNSDTNMQQFVIKV